MEPPGKNVCLGCRNVAVDGVSVADFRNSLQVFSLTVSEHKVSHKMLTFCLLLF